MSYWTEAISSYYLQILSKTVLLAAGVAAKLPTELLCVREEIACFTVPSSDLALSFAILSAGFGVRLWICDISGSWYGVTVRATRQCVFKVYTPNWGLARLSHSSRVATIAQGNRLKYVFI